MAFQRPSLQDLITRVEGDIKGGLGLVILLRRSFLKVFARVLAGLSHMLFGYIVYIEKQAFVDTADDDSVIARWGGIWGIDRKEATFADFILSVSGPVGVDIPVNTIYRRSDGVEYQTKTEVTLTGSGDTIELVALVAGAAGAVSVADVIPILSPIALLTSNATVLSIVTDPQDTEDIEAYRARILDRIRNPPSGGAATDYIQWAESVAGVTRAWVSPQALGPGTVTVQIVNDDVDPITASGPIIAAVAAFIETVRPVTANVTVVTPTLDATVMNIKIKPNTTDIQNAIIAELQDLFLREAEVAGSYNAPGVVNTGEILLSHIEEAVAVATGLVDNQIVTINTITPANVAPSTGHLCTLGTITWQTLS